MKHFAVHSVATVAILALGAQANNVVPYTFPDTIPGDCEYSSSLLESLLPCGDSTANPCWVVTLPTTGSDATPIVPCGTAVEIGTRPSVHELQRTIHAVVVGSADLGTDIKFGVGPLAFQQLCPFSCNNGTAFVKCVTNPDECNGTGEAVVQPRVVGGTTMQGGFEQQTTVHELAFRVTMSPLPTDYADFHPTDLTTAASLDVFVAGAGYTFSSATPKNCPSVAGNWTVSDLTTNCGYGGRLPCPMIVKNDNECSTDTGNCTTITFYRVGAADATNICTGGTCPPTGFVTRQFKAVHHENSQFSGRGPRGLLNPAAVRGMCPHLCGTYPYNSPGDIKEITWLPICVNSPSDCEGSQVVPDNSTIPFGTVNVPVPGSFIATPFIAVNQTSTVCGAGISSAVGTTAPGLLVLATAAVVAMYSS